MKLYIQVIRFIRQDKAVQAVQAAQETRRAEAAWGRAGQRQRTQASIRAVGAGHAVKQACSSPTLALTPPAVRRPPR